jgi:hypothetical protein
MARLGTIHLGGSINMDFNNTFNSGISFFLESESRISKIFSFSCEMNKSSSLDAESGDISTFFDVESSATIENNEVTPSQNDIWEVEVKENHKSIVARCSRFLNPDQILKCGFEVCQKALDLISVFHNKHMMFEGLGTSHVLFFEEKNKYILRVVSLANLRFETSARAVKYEKGIIVPEPIQPQPEWLKAFRYYRLSQSTKDPYEAYMYLYLSFESVLSKKIPINKHENERETDWLRRAFSEIYEDIGLSNYVPNNKKRDPVGFIVGTLYEYTRCGLFHSKEEVILPHELPNLEQVLEDYKRLLEIWRAIVSKYYKVPMVGGGFTDYGFKDAMDGTFGNGCIFQVTDDPTPFNTDDSVISPLNRPIIPFNDCEFVKDYALGQVLLTGRLEGAGLEKVILIHRLGVFKADLLAGDFIHDGLHVEEVDRIEIDLIIRLINANNPKTEF